jgi:ATP-dependent Clp protease ATP-binding subunit ClpX
MLDVMYDIPSANNIEKCIVTKDTIENRTEPELVVNENKKPLKKTAGKKSRVKKETAS